MFTWPKYLGLATCDLVAPQVSEVVSARAKTHWLGLDGMKLFKKKQKRFGWDDALVSVVVKMGKGVGTRSP